MPDLYPLTGARRSYAWGSTTAVQTMLGIDPDGSPIAELWFGAHADDPSLVGETPLDQLVTSDPLRMLGADVVDRFGEHLPFLLKILAADKPLSIQVHPGREQAAAGFDREDAMGVARTAPDRNYRDRNHKPELICALTEFEALCGFRPIEQVRELFRLIDPDRDPAFDAVSFDAGLRGAFSALLSLSDPAALVDAVVAGAGRLHDDWAGAARAIELTAEYFPGDVGTVLTLFLNYVRLDPGQAIYLGAGNVHAYLRGTGVEIMANSDNVLRCGLTPKHVDVDEVLSVTDFTALLDPVVRPERAGSAGWDYPVPVDDFSLRRIDLDGCDGTTAFAYQGRPFILLCTAGAMTLSSSGEHADLTPGQAAFHAATGAQCVLRGTGEAFVASVAERA